MIIGIVEVNDRRYCVGAWANIAALQAAIPRAIVEEITEGGAFAQTANAVYYVTIPEDGIPDGIRWYGGEPEFHAYEFTGTFPGLVGYDED